MIDPRPSHPADSATPPVNVTNLTLSATIAIGAKQHAHLRLDGGHEREAMTSMRATHLASYHTPNYVAGMVAAENGHWDESLRVLLQEPTNSPAYCLALGNAALALGVMERFKEAEELGQKVVQEAQDRGCPHAPSRVQFVRNLAEAIKRRGRRVEAIGILDTACALADELIGSDPQLADFTRLEKAHTLQSRGVTRFVIQQDSGLPAGEVERMMEDFREANGIYNSIRDPEEVGIAECQTNFALVLGANGEGMRAEYALLEASEIAVRTGNHGQITRIDMTARKLGLPALVQQGTLTPEQGAIEAVREGKFPTAFIRYCIAAQAAMNAQDLPTAARMLEAARNLESRLDPHDLEIPKLRNSAATLAEHEGRSSSEIARILTEGAHLWYTRLSSKVLQSDDFDAIARSLLDHFRRLARYQLLVGNAAEALLSFECGRALSLAVEIDPQFLDRVIRTNPFSADGCAIDTALVKEVQASLKEGQVAVALASLPPNLVAFVIRRDSIVTETVPVGTTQEESAEIHEALQHLSKRLADLDGKAAVPAQLIDLAARLRAIIGDDVVCRFVPFTFFHRVPWRALLRDAGMKWAQLPFTTEFGVLLRHAPLRGDVVAALGTIALGHGTAGKSNQIDFRDEPKAFAHAWGAGGEYVEPCTRDAVQAALRSGKVVLLSCHGKLKEDRLYLELVDGDFLADSCIPDEGVATVLILSACFSGVYAMAVGDYPLGWAPNLLRLGAHRCVCARWPVSSRMTAGLFKVLAERLKDSATFEDAFVAGLDWAECEGFDFWNQLACLEIIGID